MNYVDSSQKLNKMPSKLLRKLIRKHDSYHKNENYKLIWDPVSLWSEWLSLRNARNTFEDEEKEFLRSH